MSRKHLAALIPIFALVFIAVHQIRVAYSVVPSEPTYKAVLTSPPGYMLANGVATYELRYAINRSTDFVGYQNEYGLNVVIQPDGYNVHTWDFHNDFKNLALSLRKQNPNISPENFSFTYHRWKDDSWVSEEEADPVFAYDNICDLSIIAVSRLQLTVQWNADIKGVNGQPLPIPSEIPVTPVWK